MRFNSLRAELFFWVLVPLAAVALIAALFSFFEARKTAILIQERMLLGSARMIAEQTHYHDGVIEVQIPPASLELFQTENNADRVYYRVSAQDGRLLSGYYEMPLPAQRLKSEEKFFFDTVMRDESVRVVAFAQPLFGSQTDEHALIEVGQTNRSRDALIRQIWQRSILEQVFLLALVATLIWLGLRHGLSTVLALRAQMLLRAPGTLEPLGSEQVANELKPLVGALNDYVARLNHHMSAHSRFIADASHQLRTPLSVLNTQIAFAMRTSDAALKDEALQGLRNSIQSANRLVSQLLTFAEAEAGASPGFEKRVIDLAGAARVVVESLALMANNKQIDLGFESAGESVFVYANEHLLHTLITNLVENALNYTGTGGMTTISVAGTGSDGALLSVEDNGPGIPASERERVFERFVRLSGKELDGCGLGLAIVREVAIATGASVELLTATSGRGLCVRVIFPLADDPEGKPIATAETPSRQPAGSPPNVVADAISAGISPAV